MDRAPQINQNQRELSRNLRCLGPHHATTPDAKYVPLLLDSSAQPRDRTAYLLPF
jgi:hypothetical protein